MTCKEILLLLDNQIFVQICRHELQLHTDSVQSITSIITMLNAIMNGIQFELWEILLRRGFLGCEAV
jgi:hypothetical protein